MIRHACAAFCILLALPAWGAIPISQPDGRSAVVSLSNAEGEALNDVLQRGASVEIVQRKHPKTGKMQTIIGIGAGLWESEEEELAIDRFLGLYLSGEGAIGLWNSAFEKEKPLLWTQIRRQLGDRLGKYGIPLGRGSLTMDPSDRYEEERQRLQPERWFDLTAGYEPRREDHVASVAPRLYTIAYVAAFGKYLWRMWRKTLTRAHVGLLERLFFGGAFSAVVVAVILRSFPGLLAHPAIASRPGLWAFLSGYADSEPKNLWSHVALAVARRLDDGAADRLLIFGSDFDIRGVMKGLASSGLAKPVVLGPLGIV